MKPLPKFVGLTVLVAMAGFIALGFISIRRDIDNLRVISQDNILWSATQMEVELLRFQLSIAKLGVEQTEEALGTARNRFDILWSRVFMLGKGRVGELMRKYDEGHGSIDAISDYLEEIDPVIAVLKSTIPKRSKRYCSPSGHFSRNCGFIRFAWFVPIRQKARRSESVSSPAPKPPESSVSRPCY